MKPSYSQPLPALAQSRHAFMEFSWFFQTFCITSRTLSNYCAWRTEEFKESEAASWESCLSGLKFLKL